MPLLCGLRETVHQHSARLRELIYESQRENEMTRALRCAQGIRERLRGSTNMTKPFSEKPKGMNWRTYERLWWEHDQAETRRAAGGLEEMAR